MWSTCPEYRLSALIPAIDFSPNLLPKGKERWRNWEGWAKGGSDGWRREQNNKNRENRESREGDEVLPGGRDKTMSTPQKLASVGDHQMHFYRRRMRGLSGVGQTQSSMFSVIWFLCTVICFKHPTDKYHEIQTRQLNHCLMIVWVYKFLFFLLLLKFLFFTITLFCTSNPLVVEFRSSCFMFIHWVTLN